MTRRSTHWPGVKKGDYHRWLEDFENGPYVRRLLANIPQAETECVCTVLFAVYVGPRSLTREQVRHVWPKLNTRINLVDLAIELLEEFLKGKTQSVNEDIAALLTAAGIPCRQSRQWEPGSVKKRRVRAIKASKKRLEREEEAKRKRREVGKADTHLWLQTLGPRFLLSYIAPLLLKARSS